MPQYLCLIAIDAYQNSSFPKLNNAKLDAERFRKVLTEDYGFELIVEPLFDNTASRKNIIEELNGLSSKLQKEDSLILYFAGHGESHPITKKGYWIAHDSSNSVSDFIPNSTIIDIIEGVKAKHILHLTPVFLEPL